MFQDSRFFEEIQNEFYTVDAGTSTATKATCGIQQAQVILNCCVVRFFGCQFNHSPLVKEALGPRSKCSEKGLAFFVQKHA